MTVAHRISGVHQFSAIQTDITGRMDGTFMNKALVWEKAHGIVQTGHVCCGIDEVVPLPDMSDGRTFPIIWFLWIEVCSQKNRWFSDNCQHVGV